MLFHGTKVKLCRTESSSLLRKEEEAYIVTYDTENKRATLVTFDAVSKHTHVGLLYWDNSLGDKPSEYWTLFDNEYSQEDQKTYNRFDAIKNFVESSQKKEYSYLDWKVQDAFDIKNDGTLLIGDRATASVYIPPGARVLILIPNN